MSKFIGGMSLECFDLVEASKNITVLGEYKSVNIRLVYRDGDKRGFNIIAAFSINVGGKVSHEQSIKVLGKYYVDDRAMTTEAMKSFSPSEVTGEILAAVNKIEELFEQADLANKRLYM